MSHKSKHSRSIAANGGGAEAPDRQVRALLAQGKSRQALDLAKELHKRLGTAESESVLMDAYLARASALSAQGLTVESRMLIELAISRHPALGKRQTELLDLQASQGGLGDLVRPLADPNVSNAQREAIESVLRRRLANPADLADCAALPPEHPLRLGAAALVRALGAAASRPVTEEELALPEISRRSPLAPWKMLARAIACFHRGDDAACSLALAAIEPDMVGAAVGAHAVEVGAAVGAHAVEVGAAVGAHTATTPGRFVPTFRAMLSGEPPATSTADARTAEPALLARQILGRADGLRQALAALDAAFDAGRPQKIVKAIQRAAASCSEERPDLLTTLRQRISVKAMMDGAPADVIHSAMGGASRKDAAFWLLYARACEHMGWHERFAAAIAWDRFLCHARAEGWFADEKEETAALYRHMAGLFPAARGRDADSERSGRDHARAGLDSQICGYYKGQPEDVRVAGAIPKNGRFDDYMLFADCLYERSCALAPRDETYREWLAFARNDATGSADAVAEAWHRALPEQPAPLLELSDSAERRGALKKALGWLEAAEGLDALNPDVRRTRWRILVATAISHFKQKKPHLARKDLAQLESLEMAREGDHPILVAVLQWVLALAENDAAQLESRYTEAVRLAGETRAVTGAMQGFASIGGLGRPAQIDLGQKPAPEAGPIAVEAFQRIGDLFDECHLSLKQPEIWSDALVGTLQSPEYHPDPAKMCRLAGFALKSEDLVLAYAAAGAGLAQGDGPDTAGLLLVRSRSLPFSSFVRRENCALASLVLARQRRDTDLYSKALDAWRSATGQNHGSARFYDDTDRESLEMDPRHLALVLAHERRAVAYPAGEAAWKENSGYLADCPCERCSGEEEATSKNWGDPFGGNDFDDDDDDGRSGDKGPVGVQEDLFGQIGGDEEPKQERRRPGGGRKRDRPDLPFPDSSGGAFSVLMEMLEKHVRPDGSLPSPEEIAERDPELMEKVLRLAEERGFLSDEEDDSEDGDEDDGDDESGDSFDPRNFDQDAFLDPPRQRTKTQRKRKSKKKK